MPIFSRKKEKTKKPETPLTNGNTSTRPRWEDAWLRTRVDPEEVAELLQGCTHEIKSRGLDVPFLLLPFRPSSDPSATKSFVRNYFYPPADRQKLMGDGLIKELKMTEVMVLIAVMKWCWARLPGGVVSWEVYQGFKVGEKDSGYARNAYTTFVPLSTESKARVQIINNFFELMAALAAHGKSNGLGGHKLSRYAGWWAFEHYDTGKGFDAGYKQWTNAANATSHLFFAYLRSSTPEPGSTNGILNLPRSLQQLLDSVTYPPPATFIANDTTKVVMIVDAVSPTPFALLRRAKQFEYRNSDIALRKFAEFHDPVDALSEECRRVLKAISSTNQLQVSDAKTSTSLNDPSWSRFEDIGFGSAFDETAEDDMFSRVSSTSPHGLSTISRSRNGDLNRPTTPSWADFLSSGFVDENGNKAPPTTLLPPDKALPPMGNLPRGQSSQSHRRDLDTARLEPGELASIANFELDDSFWWVWISSLAGEEPVARKAAFGRCALIETSLLGGQWMMMEEQVKGSEPEPIPGAYVAERKSFFSFTKKSRLGRRRSQIKKDTVIEEPRTYDPSNRLTLDQDKQAKIQKAAAELAQKKELEQAQPIAQKRGRVDENSNVKTSSVFTLGALIKDEASPALQWAKQYDRKAIREQYLGKNLAAKDSTDYLYVPSPTTLHMNASTSTLSIHSKELPPAPNPSEKVKTEAQIVSAPAVQPPVEQVARQAPVTTEFVQERPEPPRMPPPPPPAHMLHPPTVPPPPVPQHPMVPPPPVPVVEPQPRNNVAAPSTSVTSIPDIVTSRQSSESRRSNRSDKDKTIKEKSRLKKLGFNAPPPVSTNKVSGMRKMFGSMRKKDFSNNHLSPDSPTNEDPAIAAARRALEGKPALPGDGPTSPPLSPNHFVKLQDAATAAKAAASEQVMRNTHGTAEPEPEAEHETTAAKAVEIEHEPAAVPETPVIEQSVHEQVTQVKVPEHIAEPVQEIPSIQEPSNQPPIQPSTAKDDQINGVHHTRVVSQDKINMSKEVPKFDQGPLTDQPAFAPTGKIHDDDSETEMPPAFEPPIRPQHQSVYSNVTMQSDATEEDAQSNTYLSTAAHDRWAQIRKNAAERAAMASEEQRNRNGSKTTDDSETSGEETIESRVARIKARVAELTGNMEATRR